MTILSGGIVPRMDIAQAVIEEMPNMDAFAAHRIFPPVPVQVSTGPIPKILRRARIERLYKPKYGQFPTGTLIVNSAATFNCQESGFDEQLDAKDLEILGGPRGQDFARKVAAIKASQTVLLARDAGLAATLMTTALFTSGYNAAGVATWGGGTDKPITDITNAIESVRKASGMPANRMVIGGGAWNKLLQSSAIQNSLRNVMGYSSIQGVNFFQLTKAVAMALGLGGANGDGDIIVAGAVKDTSNEGQTKVLASVWDDTKALVFYRAESGDFVSPGLGRMFMWQNGDYVQPGITQDESPLNGLIVEQVPDVLSNTERIRAREFIDMQVLNLEAGFLVTGI